MISPIQRSPLESQDFWVEVSADLLARDRVVVSFDDYAKYFADIVCGIADLSEGTTVGAVLSDWFMHVDPEKVDLAHLTGRPHFLALVRFRKLDDLQKYDLVRAQDCGFEPRRVDLREIPAKNAIWRAVLRELQNPA